MYTKNISKHQETVICKRARVRRKNENLQDKQVEAEQVRFLVYGKELERVKEFWYLGRIFTENDDDTKCIEIKLKRARQKQNSIAKS